MHYMRWRTHGDPHVLLSNYGKPVLDRFMEKLSVDSSGCWLWIAHIDSDRYGILKVDGKNRKAHRWSYEHYIGPIPADLDLDHLCRVRHCVNPLHLEPVTTGENQRRGLNGALKTLCVNGHAYTPDNVMVTSAGRRRCIICEKEAQQRHRAKQRKR